MERLYCWTCCYLKRMRSVYFRGLYFCHINGELLYVIEFCGWLLKVVIVRCCCCRTLWLLVLVNDIANQPEIERIEVVCHWNQLR